jgi:hypothetical protein
MGEAATGLTLHGSAEARAIELDLSIAATRARLGSLLEELDRRRRQAIDVPAQIRKNAKPLLVAAAGVAALVGLSIALRIARHRRRDRPIERVRRLGRAVGRMIDDPDRVAAPPPNFAAKVLMAVATTAATTLAATAVKRSVENVILPPAREGAIELRSMLPPSPRQENPLPRR